MRDRLSNYFLFLFVFLLPWQTRWIFSELTINGDVTEYGKLAVYATEILLLFVMFLRGRPQILQGAYNPVRYGYFILAAGFFSVSLAAGFGVGLIQLLHIILALSFFTILCDQRTNVKQVIIVFLIGLIVPVVFGIAQFFSGTNPASSYLGMSYQNAQIPGTAVIETEAGRSLRAYGSFSHPNIFGGYLMVGILLIAWIVRFQTTRNAHLLSVPLILFAVSLIFTFSRSAWLGLILSLLVLSGLMLWQRKVPPRRVFPIMILGLMSVLVTISIFNSEVYARFRPELRVEAISIEERASQYTHIDDIILSRPVFGVGPGGYVFALSQLTPNQSAWSYQPIHNTYLLILAEIGVLGFFGLFWFLMSIDKISSSVSKTAGGMFAFTLSLALFVVGLFDHYLWSSWAGLALCALCLALILRWSLTEKKGE